jgi:hypothetical protein
MYLVARLIDSAELGMASKQLASIHQLLTVRR